jgi:hypothetical protein
MDIYGVAHFAKYSSCRLGEALLKVMHVLHLDGLSRTTGVPNGEQSFQVHAFPLALVWIALASRSSVMPVQSCSPHFVAKVQLTTHQVCQQTATDRCRTHTYTNTYTRACARAHTHTPTQSINQPRAHTHHAGAGRRCIRNERRR